jgi:hypothetical protein
MKVEGDLMRLRTLSLVSLVLASCAPDGDTAVGSTDPGVAPSYEAPSGVTTNATAPAPSLLACNQVRVAQRPTCSSSERALTSEDALALGFEAEAFLRLISGEHRSEMKWGDEASPSSELVLTVEPLGEVRFVDQQALSAGHSAEFTLGNTGGRYLTCGDRLAVDARLSIVSSDGALNEVAVASIQADSGSYARSVVQLPTADLAGSLRTLLRDGDEPHDELTLVLGISELGSGLEGSLATHAALLDNGDVEQGAPCSQLGSFRLASSCPLGSFQLAADETLLGLSFTGALERLNATSPAALDDTGAQLTLAVEASPTAACISIDTPASLPSVLMFPGTARLESSDGRIGGSMAVQLSAEALGGALQRVTAHTEYLVPDPSGLSELAPSYAILQPLSWGGESLGGFEFSLEANEQGSGGLLRAIGGNLGCNSSRPCPEVCPGPGCTVTNAEKWAVRWGDLPVGAELPLQAPVQED